MDHPLDSARDKLRRADEHLDCLNAQTRAWLKGKPYEFYLADPVRPIDSLGLHFELHVGVVQQPPWELSATLGDALHNLRGVLDHIFWALVTRNATPTWEQARTIAFPIAKKYETFMDRPGIKSFVRKERSRPGVNRVSYAERLAIQRHQPYRRQDPASHPLAILRTLNDHDKHQTVHPALVALEEPPPKIVASDGIIDRLHYFSGRPLEEGAHIADVWLRDYGPNAKVQVEFVSVSVAFGGNPPMLLRSLGTIRDEVAAVLAEFVYAFSP